MKCAPRSHTLIADSVSPRRFTERCRRTKNGSTKCSAMSVSPTHVRPEDQHRELEPAESVVVFPGDAVGNEAARTRDDDEQ